MLRKIPVSSPSPLLTYDQLTKREPYKSNSLPTYELKNGQRKLFETEMYFIMFCIDKLQKDNFNVLYIGAADGKHINGLQKLFPKIHWILYDPRKFMIQPSSKVEIHQTFFTDATCKTYLSVKDLVVISDVRTMDDTDKADTKLWYKLIQDDMEMQAKWIKKIKPKCWSLKFKLNPYLKSQKYLDGTIVLQPWVSAESIETRLIGTNTKMKTYDPKEYEEKMYYYNKTLRRSAHGNNDEVIENYLIAAYQKYNKSMTKEHVKNIIRQNCIIQNF